MATTSEGRENYYAEKIGSAWQRSIEAIIEGGVWLTKAKNELAHGSFGALVTDKLKMSLDTAQRLMRIAADPRIAAHARHLPASWMTLFEISRLSDDQFDLLIHVGTIRPDMRRCDLDEAVRQLNPQKPPKPADSKKPGPVDSTDEDRAWRFARRADVRDERPGVEDVELAPDEERAILIEFAEFFLAHTTSANGRTIAFCVRGDEARKVRRLMDLCGSIVRRARKPIARSWTSMAAPVTTSGPAPVPVPASTASATSAAPSATSAAPSSSEAAQSSASVPAAATSRASAGASDQRSTPSPAARTGGEAGWWRQSERNRERKGGKHRQAHPKGKLKFGWRLRR